MAGKLYICGTPIGNMEDITLRALRILKEADIIAAEDTRNTMKILNSYDIKTRLTSYHKFNENEKGQKLVTEMLDGKNVALVSDAGMPGISDPGEILINLCRDAGIEVTVVPGPTAAVSALVLSGIGGRSFVFEGFLPENKRKRRDVLEKLKSETRTTVFYEAPHHLADTLEEIFGCIGNREAAVVRELTKKYEEVKRGELGELVGFYRENTPRGEFVILIKGGNGEKPSSDKFETLGIKEHYNMLIENGYERKEAIKKCAAERGISRRQVYNELI